MATGRTTHLTGAIGEFLVAAELCRLKLLATPFAGNVPHYDIIASGQSGGHLAVQVKATNTSTWQFDISKFAEVQLPDGILWEKHKEYLLRHGGIRPKSPTSFHCALKLEDIKAYEGQWQTLQDRIATSSSGAHRKKVS
jgi:hypothetical protein